jgi:hypothetical protein
MLIIFCFKCFLLIPLCSEDNIVDDISAKHKLAWCCLQCCVISASDILVNTQLIGGSNQMDDLLVFKSFMIIFQVK